MEEDEKTKKDMIERLNEQHRRHQRQLWLDKFPLMWIFDPRIEETHRGTRYRDATTAYKRMKIRHFFSWENLLRFSTTPYFKISLYSILSTLILAHISLTIEEHHNQLSYDFPLQMSILFLAGIAILIAHVLNATWCPYLIKELKSKNGEGKQIFQFKERLVNEFRMTILRLLSFEVYSKRDLDKISKYHPDSDIIINQLNSGLPAYKVGIAGYGQWTLERFFLSIAKKSNKDIYYRRGFESKPKKLTHPSEIYIPYARGLENIEICLEKDNMHDKNLPDNQIYLVYSEHRIEHEPIATVTKDSFAFVAWDEQIFDLAPQDNIAYLIAELQNYTSPVKRLTVSFFLFLSSILIFIFVILQFIGVMEAAF